MTHLPLPSWRDRGATSDSKLQKPPRTSGHSRAALRASPARPLAQDKPGQMVEAQTWDPSPKTAQALSYGHRIREALPWVWAWKIFRFKRLGKHLLILIIKILSFSAPRNVNLFFQLRLF